MPNILFVCSANRFRSVIAAAYFQVLLDQERISGNWSIASAGTWAQEGLAPLPQATEFAKSRGMAIENKQSREIDRTLLDEADLVIVMSEGQKEALNLEFPQVKNKIFLLSEMGNGETYDIPDPISRVDENPEELGEEICRLISSGFTHIIDQSKQFQSQRD